MSLSVGIVGLPNVGKSTLFNALTKLEINASNYPFATIEPNTGVVPVPDERLQQLAKVENSKEIIPTIVEYKDIAGLVSGAHKGEGLGNQFLSHILEVDAIVEVVRFFKDDNVIHVDGSIDPKRDLETIETELILADLEMIEKKVKKLEKSAKSGDKVELELLSIAKKYADVLADGKLAKTVTLDEMESKHIHEFPLLTNKPILYIATIEEGRTPEEIDGKQFIAIDAKKTLGIDRLIKETYKLLDLITFFTAGEKESRAWTCKAGTKAPQAAGVIHTDFEQGFIKAEVIDWETLVNTGSYAEARSKGQIRTEGKDYVIKDGDVVHFRFNV